MIEGKLWRARKQGVEKVQQWRPRRSRFGELVQWDTSDRDWLEGRGDPMLLINRIDDATSRWFCAFGGERLDGGKHERAGAGHEKARTAAGGLHRPGGAV